MSADEKDVRDFVAIILARHRGYEWLNHHVRMGRLSVYQVAHNKRRIPHKLLRQLGRHPVTMAPVRCAP